MKPINWLGDSRKAVSDFSDDARRDAGFQLERVQQMSKENLIIKQGSGNVFADMGFPPEEAQNLILRAELINQIEDYVASSGMTQQQTAKKLGVTQPRLNLLLKGKINEFSIDALVNMAAKAGMQVEMKVKRAAWATC